MELTIDEVKQYLTQKGMETTELTDDEINRLINSKSSILKSRIGFDYDDTEREYFERHYCNDSIILDDYPVKEINSIMLNGKLIDPKEYSCFKPDGIVYFEYTHKGKNLLVDYSIDISDEEYSFIKSLILDMIRYTYSNNPLLDATSVKEGDSSINFDTSSLLKNDIENRMDELKMMHVQVRMF